MSTKRLISLFDYSGVWGLPFAQNGWEVIQWDIKLNKFMDINLFKRAGQVLEMFEYCDGILAAPPCTEFTASCAQYWKVKDEDGRTAAAIELVKQVERFADLFTPTDPEFDGTFFWGLENPVGRIGKLTNIEGAGKPVFFHPWEFAGYLNPSEQVLKELDHIRAKDGEDVTDEESDFVVKWNAYTKKTGLWGDFNRTLVKKPVEKVKCSPQGSFTQRLGGSSVKTKEERSNTPYGFALAFYEANKEYRGDWYDPQEEIEEAA